MSQQKFGGEIRLNTSTGQNLKLRAAVETNPSSISTDAVINQDGSIAKTAELTGFRASATFEEPLGANVWDDLMRLTDINIRCVEDFTGAVHAWTAAMFVGDPQVNRANGEVTGVTWIAEAFWFLMSRRPPR